VQPANRVPQLAAECVSRGDAADVVDRSLPPPSGSPVFRRQAAPGMDSHDIRRKEFMMSGEFDQAKGRVKQAVGDLTDDDELEREGETDEAAGKVKEAIGKGKERLEEAVDDVRDRVE
jgi:uncharacterized protein YjbJ (UPF0337 family)